MDGNRRKSSVSAEYKIIVRGKLDESWSRWFSGLSVNSDYPEPETSITTLQGIVVDQAALRGILTRLWDLNLEIISIKQIIPDTDEEARNG